MSTTVHVEQVTVPENEEALRPCPECGYKIPESLVVCWNCGKRLVK